jgi:hypothetical protein
MIVFAESMLSIGEDLVFVEIVHDVAVDYMLQYLTYEEVRETGL